MKILLIILSLLSTNIISFNAFAEITVSSVSGTSNDVDLDEEGVIELLGGLSGVDTCASVSPAPTSTINSCILLNNRASCNFKTICSTSEALVTITSSNTSGSVVLVDSEDNLIDVYSTTYTQGQTYTAEILWGDICTAIGGTLCAGATITTGSENFKLGIDSDGDDIPDDFVTLKFGIYGIANTAGESLNGTDGVADYTLFPGDEKAFVTDFSAVADYSIPEAAPIVGLRGFFAPTTCAAVSVTPTTVNNGSDSYLIDIDEDNKEIVDNRIDEGLINDETYVFMFGFQDEAGNIGGFKDLAGACTTDQHSVMPRDVFGLLEENQNCFISTAAFGSPLNSKVKVFKEFRDEVLNQFSIGKKFVRFYYKNSPPIAKAIQENEFLRLATRAILWPAWAVSSAVLYMGLMPFLFVVTMILLTIVFLRGQFKSSKKIILIFAILSSTPLVSAQDAFTITPESESATEVQESAPKEPPYTEADEFNEFEKEAEDTAQAEEEYEPEIIEANDAPTSFNNVGENPNKWKPYQRVPDEDRLKELSEKGLIKITKKGGYNYDVPQSEQKSAASFRLGAASFPNLKNPNPNSDVYFEDIYDTDKKPVLLVDYEWQFFQGFGKLGIKVGSGLMLATGKGQFATPYQGSTEAMEKYSFYMFPNSLSAIYRLDVFNKQWIVPYAEAGVDYLAFIEARDDGEEIKFGGSPHFHFAVGGSFLLDLLGRDMMAEIDRQYGVNHLWLTAEYRRLESMGGDFDFTDDIVNAGIMVEF